MEEAAGYILKVKEYLCGQQNETLHSLIWGQSSKSTQSKLETHQDFNDCKSTYDSLKLLKIICEFFFKSDNWQY